MSRSLFAVLNARYGPKVDPAERRRFLAASVATGMGLLLSGRTRAFAGLGATGWNGAALGAKRVVVIGAGFAGLACAHELQAAGYDVSVVEATPRVGGRVFSFNKELGTEWIAGRNIEGGGELVGINHPTWQAYAKKFNLEFLPVTELEDAEFPIVLNGQKLTPDESASLYEELDAALGGLNELAAPVVEDAPWETPDAKSLDARPLSHWIDQLEVSKNCKAAIFAQMAGDNGQSCDKQSLLGNLAQIKGGQLEKYWTDSETDRCKGGNQLLAVRLAETLRDRITTKLPARAIEIKGSMVVVTCADGRTLECDDVVVATPPSVWNKIDFKPGLPSALTPQMGVNVKHFSHVKSRFWKENKIDPTCLADGEITWTWDGTDAQEGDSPACLTCFSGGPAAERARARRGDEQRKAYGTFLESVYKGYTDNLVETRFMDWPGFDWTKAGYSFPAPGQVTSVGPMLAKGLGGRIHFAGEHACYKFVGYMEGALNSGASVAKRLAIRDGVAK
ncbi:MAG: NAD(P)/FAD-dependent oxidoreductase [Planctomycetota bacterium]|nr:NAD(P)/FAD-dependent oxidoreductase [Planctomycetota bacterium]